MTVRPFGRAASLSEEQEAEEKFLATVDLPKFGSGKVPLACDGNQYFGEVEHTMGLGVGSYGVTVGLRTKLGDRVVAKIATSSDNTTVEHECNIYKILQKKGVPNTLTCLGFCIHNDHPMIIVSPLVEKPFERPDGELESSYFGYDDDAFNKAVHNTFLTLLAMLEARIVNYDQGHNILYGKDGSTFFIDMGLATKLTDESHDGLLASFVSAVLDKVPVSWWTNGNESISTESGGTEERNIHDDVHLGSFISAVLGKVPKFWWTEGKAEALLSKLGYHSNWAAEEISRAIAKLKEPPIKRSRATRGLNLMAMQ